MQPVFLVHYVAWSGLFQEQVRICNKQDRGCWVMGATVKHASLWWGRGFSTDDRQCTSEIGSKC